jgi:hypothetical protein
MKIKSIIWKEVSVREIADGIIHEGVLLKPSNHPIPHNISYQADFPD